MLTIDQKRRLFSAIDYDPHVGQLPAHASQARLIQVVGAERSGKSKFTAVEALCELAPNPHDPRGPLRPKCIALAAQSYDETHQEMGYLIEDCQRLGLLDGGISTPRVGKWQFETLTRGSVETVSLKDGADELTGRGKAFDMVCLVEAGRIPYSAFTAARGRVAETRGRVIMSGTLVHHFGWYAEMADALTGPNPHRGATFSFPAWFNTAVYPGGRQDPEILLLEAEYDRHEFARRVAAERLPSTACIYTEFQHWVHVRDLELDEEGLIDLAIDPGYFPSKYAILAIQPTRNESGRECVNVVDEIWENDLTHQDVIALCKERPWWDRVRRLYGGHETTQHAATKSTEEVWRELTGLPFEIVKKATRKVHPIMRVKTFLRDPETELPRLLIDVQCQGLIHEFPRYERKTDRFGNVMSDDPDPKAEDDALDALTNYLVGRFGLVDKRKRAGRRGHRPSGSRG